MKNSIALFTMISALGAPAAMAGPLEVQTLFINSGTVDLASDTITLPLHHGSLKDGREVWFVLTDASDQTVAQAMGLEYAPSIAGAAGVTGTRTAALDNNGEFVFNAGSVDFSPKAQITPGAAPNFFPPTLAQPGSQADADYSPFVETADGTVYNAPILAFNVDASAISFCSGSPDYNIVHDKVVSICPKTETVTLKLSHGYSDSASIIYLSFDANITLAATMESATYAPAEDALKTAGVSQRLYAVTNGETGASNPDRQGFDSALSGDGSPLNILTIGKTATDYSPLWDLHIATWTDTAIAAGDRKALTNAKDFNAAAAAGQLKDVSGAATVGSSGILVNCPVVGILN